MAEASTLAPDIAFALDEANYLTTFQTLPKSHQQEYLTWIDGAKKTETRSNRIIKMVEMLKDTYPKD